MIEAKVEVVKQEPQALPLVDDIFFYVVMNSEGKFFRRKGYGGYGKTWTDTIATARVYAKIGPARATVSFFANHYSSYPAPSIVKLGINSVEILDETKRVEKQKAKKKKDKEERELNQKKWELERAERDYKDAQDRLKRYQK